MFDLAGKRARGINRKFLDIYLNRLSTIELIHTDSRESKQPSEHRPILNLIESVALIDFLEILHVDADKAARTVQPTMEEIITIMDKLVTQYHIRIYLIDFTETTRISVNYPDFPFEDRRVMDKLDEFFEKPDRARIYEPYDITRNHRDDTDWPAIQVFTYQLAKYKIPKANGSYVFAGRDYSELLFLRRFYCVAVLILCLGVVDNEALDEDDTTDTANLSEEKRTEHNRRSEERVSMQANRAFGFAAWLRTLKDYYTPTEWERVRTLILRYDDINVARETSQFFSYETMLENYNGAQYYTLIRYLIMRV
jgi:hypothetical protein